MVARDPMALRLNFTLRGWGEGYLDLGSQIVRSILLRLYLNLTCFEMSYKNILQKFCGKYYRDFFRCENIDL